MVGILLRDSLRLMNAPDRESEVPLYTEHQVEQLLRSMAPVRYHQPIQVGEIEIRWLPASHILGAAMVLMKTPAGTILLTGTYGLSAHADRMQMVSLIEATSPRTVVLVHDEEGAKQSLARSLRCRDVLCARDGLTIQRRYPPRSPRRGSDRSSIGPRQSNSPGCWNRSVWFAATIIAATACGS